MSTAILSETHTNNPNNNWRTAYNSDDLINAYLKGKEEAIQLQMEKMRDLLRGKLDEAMEKATQFYLSSKYQESISFMFLSPDNFEAIKVLVGVDSEFYYTDSYYSLIEESFEFCDNIEFKFIQDHKSVNRSSIDNDGYVFEFRREG